MIQDRPETRWASTVDGASIAYQDFGSGPVTLVCIMGDVTHLEIDWEWPGHAAFMRRLSRDMRVLNFDKRGTGMSDRMTTAPGLDTQMDDVRAVMDAAGVERAALLGIGNGGPALAAVFAATHPERSLALFIYGWLYEKRTPENPMGVTEEELMEEQRTLLPRWGSEDLGQEYVRWWMPPFEHVDASGLGLYLAKVARYAHTPTSYQAFVRVWFETDVRDLLPTIHVPTFFIAKVPGGAYGASEWRATLRHHLSTMPCARLLEVPGSVDPVMLDDPAAFVAGIEAAIRGVRDEEAVLDRRLATVLFTDVVGSTVKAAELGDAHWTELLERHNTAVRALIARYRGTEVKATGDGFLVTFDGPARAVKCAQGICEAVRPMGLEVRTGCHTGEIELLGADIGGIAVHVGARIAALAGASEVLVSSTVKDLVAGSGLVFTDRGEHSLKGVAGTWRVFSAEYGA
jgi:class 3 adenylate cyclase/pimeloyl-ACP methyl ester carboxylesterase